MSVERWGEVARRDRVCQASAFEFRSTVACEGVFVVHHRWMRSHGGSNELDNLVLLCRRHHNEVHDHPKRAYDCGLLVRSSTTLR